jgi:hypothetical protein
MRVSVLSSLVEVVYAECNSRSWPALERSLIVIDVAGGQVSVQSEGNRLSLDGPAMVVPLGRLVETLRRTLLAGGDDAQEMLRFPPVAQPADLLRRRAGQA